MHKTKGTGGFPQIMNIKNLSRRGKNITNNATFAYLKCFITLWALSGNSLSLMLSGYSMDVPIAKYFFTLLSSFDGWGIGTLFTALGLGTVYYLVRDRQKSPWVSGISAFFAICTVIGISYSKTGSWDCILFAAYIFEQKKSLLRKEPVKAAEIFLFQKHPFAGPLLFILILALPWLFFFFPGTLQWDAMLSYGYFFGIRRPLRPQATIL